MKILIPSYHRAAKQKTLELLTKLGYPKDEIYIFIQAEEDIEPYQRYADLCHVEYMPAHNVAGNRNNALSCLHKDEMALMLDDDVLSISIYNNGKFERIQTCAQLIAAAREAFEYCKQNNAHTFCANQLSNEFFLAPKAAKKPYDLNKLGGWLWGIIKDDISFDEKLRTKEDYDFILAHIAKGENTVILNKWCVKTPNQQKFAGGCQDVHTPAIETETARMLEEKYPRLVEVVDGTEIRLTTECVEGYNSPRWTGEILDCSLPVTLDTYSNCSFGCVYCFSQYQRGIGDKRKQNYFQKKVSSISPEKVKQLFTGERNSEFTQWFKERRPIQYGGLSDQFDGYERKYGKTYELLKYLREINYPICFSTKSSWVFFDEKYRELFKGADNWNMKFSIITLDEEDARKIEVGVPSPQKRLAAMREYNKLSKGGTTLRLRPFIIGVSDKTYLDLIRAAHDAGATAVTTEFFCLEMRSINLAKEHYQTISDVCGFDVVDFYRKHSTSQGYLRLNRKIKEPYIKKMQELCHELGMRFYVSDACFKECSDNTCCCALPPEWDYSRGHFAAALQIAKKTGEVHWRDIEPDLYWADFNAVKSQCNLARISSESRAKYSGLTMKEFIRYIWNNPARGQSPYKIFAGVLIPDGRDENGDVIYKYNTNVTFQPVLNEDYRLKEL